MMKTLGDLKRELSESGTASDEYLLSVVGLLGEDDDPIDSEKVAARVRRLNAEIAERDERREAERLAKKQRDAEMRALERAREEEGWGRRPSGAYAIKDGVRVSLDNDSLRVALALAALGEAAARK